MQTTLPERKDIFEEEFKMNMMKILCAGAAASLLAACGTLDVESARKAPNNGSEFAKALQAEYVGLAQAEYDEQDWSDTTFFLEKALAVAGGADVGPQEISGRDLPADRIPVLTGARDRLLAALTAGGPAKAPLSAAKAQAGFDCWMQEQEENIQPKDIEACMKMYTSAIEKVEAALQPVPAPTSSLPPVPGPYTVYFGYNENSLSDAAAAIVAKAAKEGSDAKVTDVVVRGYADRSGNISYNEALGYERAYSVIQALEENGLKADNFMPQSLGESANEVPTADGKKEARNRRAVILFSR
ncbi:MAG: OmpA family protein [Rhodospirillales bacterium]